MPEVAGSDQIGDIGVSIVQLKIENELKWVFRREEHRDTGIDAHVEVVLAGQATGMLLALQIKTGSAYFREKTPRGWKYRGNYDHLTYWRNHNMSALIVLVNQETQKAYWQHVGQETEIHEAENSWTIEVPENQEICVACQSAWEDLAWAADPQTALFRYCKVHQDYIELLESGGRIFVEVDEWQNKTRGQAEMKLILQRPNGTSEQHPVFVFAGIHEPYAFLTFFFPWADIEIDEEFYGDNEEVEPEAVFQDDDEPDGYFIIPGERPTGTRPYTEKGGGEVASYRFELTLNETGEAYLRLKNHGNELREYPPYYRIDLFEG